MSSHSSRQLCSRAARTSLLLTLTLALSAPGASAKGGGPQHVAPPGNPGVTQYLEDVPGDKGSAPPRSGQPTQVLSASQRKRLDGLGPDGKLLVAVDNETAPAASSKAGSHGTQRSKPADVVAGRTRATVRLGKIPSASRTGSGSVAAAVLGAAADRGGSGGVGLLLPVLIGGALLLLGVPFARRRRAHRS